MKLGRALGFVFHLQMDIVCIFAIVGVNQVRARDGILDENHKPEEVARF